MFDLSWETSGKRTNPLEYKGNVYFILFNVSIVQVFENDQLIIEEDLTAELASHRNPSIPLEDQLLDWASTVLSTFIQTCGVCKREKISFPLELTSIAHHAGALQQENIEVICPSCEEVYAKELEKQASHLKHSFLTGDLHFFGGSENEIEQIMRSKQGHALRQYIMNFPPSWTLGRLCFSPHRYFIVALKIEQNEVESFLLLSQNADGQIQGLPPEVGLEALGFLPGDQIQIQAFDL